TRIDRALMLEQQVHQRLAAIAPAGREQQIGVPFAQPLIDKAAGAEREALPVEPPGELSRYHGLQRTPGMLRLAEYQFEERIMRALCTLRHHWQCRYVCSLKQGLNG